MTKKLPTHPLYKEKTQGRCEEGRPREMGKRESEGGGRAEGERKGGGEEEEERERGRKRRKRRKRREKERARERPGKKQGKFQRAPLSVGFAVRRPMR